MNGCHGNCFREKQSPSQMLNGQKRSSYTHNIHTHTWFFPFLTIITPHSKAEVYPILQCFAPGRETPHFCH